MGIKIKLKLEQCVLMDTTIVKNVGKHAIELFIDGPAKVKRDGYHGEAQGFREKFVEGKRI